MVGITPIVWSARPDMEFVLGQLHAGSNGASAQSAAVAWQGVAAAWADAAATTTRVATALGINMQSGAGEGAFARLGQYFTWVGETATRAEGVSAAAQAHAATYAATTVASAAAVTHLAVADTAVTTTANPPGVATGANAAALTDRAAAQATAGAVMDGYDSASLPLRTVPVQFTMPPPIANGAGQVAGLLHNPVTDFIQNLLNNAGEVQQVVGQASQIAASAGSQVVHAAGAFGEHTLSTINSGGAPLSGGMATSPMSAANLGTGGGLGGTTVAFGTSPLPAGWGGAGISPSTGSAMAMGTPTAGDREHRNVVRPAANSAALGPARRDEADESPHEVAENLKVHTETFAYGRTALTGVIGAPETEA